MPRGRKGIVKDGENTRFDGYRAAIAGEKGRQSQRAMKPVALCLKGIATEALYGHPPLPESQLRAVADFFKIKVKEVTFAHLALFKQSVEMAKGDAGAFNLVAAYAGEKPTENIAVTTSNFDALNAAFEAMNGDEGQ